MCLINILISFDTTIKVGADMNYWLKHSSKYSQLYCDSSRKNLHEVAL